MANRYREADRGRFDSYLIDCKTNAAVAYTDYDVVKLTHSYTDEDRAAVEAFANSYGLNIDYESRYGFTV
jgi:hypothetical protein